MARPKGVRMTKQIRAYEETAEFLADLARRKKPGTTLAEVLEDAVRTAYPLYDEIIRTKRQQNQMLDQTLGRIEDE